MNSLIEKTFKDFKVDNKVIPVSFLEYIGTSNDYITYQYTDSDGILTGDDAILGYVEYYDIDIYSKSNYLKIVKEVIKKMTQAGFMFQPSRTSSDVKEKDTGLYHKTLCFAREKMEE